MTAADRPADPRYQRFPPGFFDRIDTSDDAAFYRPARLVPHIDDRAIAAVGSLYQRLGLDGDVLDLMGSWISHFPARPRRLVVQGMNAAELGANAMATGAVVADLNRHQGLPFADASFDGAVCCVSVDYLIRPLEVFDEVARVLRPGSVFCCSFSNRCFPTKAIRGWLAVDDGRYRADVVATYFQLSAPWHSVEAAEIFGPSSGGDPLHAVWATR